MCIKPYECYVSKHHSAYDLRRKCHWIKYRIYCNTLSKGVWHWWYSLLYLYTVYIIYYDEVSTLWMHYYHCYNLQCIFLYINYIHVYNGLWIHSKMIQTSPEVIMRVAFVDSVAKVVIVFTGENSLSTLWHWSYTVTCY